MKQLLILLLLLSSCKKDKQEMVRYEVETWCNQVTVSYEENGHKVSKTIDVDSAWVYDYMRTEGTDLYLSVSHGCLTNDRTVIRHRVNGSLYIYAVSKAGEFVEIRTPAKGIDDFYK